MPTRESIGSRLAGLFGIAGKTAIITGAASGLGRETATLFADLGAQVVVADLNADAAAATARAICDQGGRALAVAVDIADESSVSRLFESTVREFHSLDILVNNAAHRFKAEFFEMSVEEWDRMHAVTTRGTFLCSREAIKLMRAAGRGGAIVNVSSISALHTTLWGVSAHYDSAKSGVDSLTRGLAGEFAADNIRVNSVLPGGIRSEGGQRISATVNMRGPMVGPGRIPLGRTATPLEVAQVVLFLASPASSYVTGQLLAADGGFMVS